jgi:hypothetical protein
MIAQTIAIRHPSRTASLTSIYATTGNPKVPGPTPAVFGLLVTPPPIEREAFIEHQLRLFKTLTGPGFPMDEQWTRKIIADSYDRCFYQSSVINFKIESREKFVHILIDKIVKSINLKIRKSD